MSKLSRASVDAMHRDLEPLAAQVNVLAGKHGVTPSTIAKHILLVPVNTPGAPEWNRRLAEHRREG